MHAMWWVVIAVGIYLAIGVVVAVAASQSPWGADGWLWTMFLWPLLVYAILFG